MLFEKGIDINQTGHFKHLFSAFNKEKGIIKELTPPPSLGLITVFDIWDRLENKKTHYKRCENWAKNVWQAWENYHSVIKEWVHLFLKYHSIDLFKNTKL